VSLEFDKVADQVERMGRHLSYVNMSLEDKLAIALERFEAATDLEAIHKRIELVRRSDVSGYRGAAPYDEPVPSRFNPIESPESATVIAADGSQIYPDQHAAVPYYLTNIGLFAYYHGPEQRLPDQFTDPQLVYAPLLLFDHERQLVNRETVNARRAVAEMQALANMAWTLRGEARPLVALYDGTLLKYYSDREVTDARQIMSDYHGALVHLHDTQALLAGYIDATRSRVVISLLHLLSLAPEDVTQANLETDGDLEGLHDAALFGRVLGPGQRSAVMIQNSPHNLTYRRRGENYEIGFFYLNVANNPFRAEIVRLDIPVWVGRDKEAVESLQALILEQCAIQNSQYPYALTRADELAVVSHTDHSHLDEMIAMELLKYNLPVRQSSKLETKGHARGNRQQHRLR